MQLGLQVRIQSTVLSLERPVISLERLATGKPGGDKGNTLPAASDLGHKADSDTWKTSVGAAHVTQPCRDPPSELIAIDTP